MRHFSIFVVFLIYIIKIHDFSSIHRKFDPNDPTILITNQLPTDGNNQIEYKLMPYVGNGHLASTIFDNKVYLNGLYNGERGESHRARVPNIHNFTIISPDPNGFQNSHYALNMKEGLK